MRVIIHENYTDASAWTARHIARRINTFNPSAERPFVLGLPTGSSPVAVYRELVQLFNEKKVSFRHVVTFNMDEYAGLPADHPQSYHFFMQQHLFRHVDISPGHINIPDGTADNLDEECRRYEEKIHAAGGIHLFLGGMGSDGHIAFNEPGSSLSSRTRVKTLCEETRIANARFFENDPGLVPETALSVGVGTVMDADEVVLIVTGNTKAQALRQCVEGGVSHMCTASMLQVHKQAVIVCDDAAADKLKVRTVRYFKDIEREAIAMKEF